MKKVGCFKINIRGKRKNVNLFVLVSYGVCIYIQYFFDVVRNKLQTINIY